MKSTDPVSNGPMHERLAQLSESESTKSRQDRIKSTVRLAYSLRETADLLGTSYVSVWRLINRGLLKPSRALRTPKISHEEILRFLRETSGAV